MTKAADGSDGQEDMHIRPKAVVGQMLQWVGWAIGRMGSRADQHYRWLCLGLGTFQLLLAVNGSR